MKKYIVPLLLIMLFSCEEKEVEKEASMVTMLEYKIQKQMFDRIEDIRLEIYRLENEEKYDHTTDERAHEIKLIVSTKKSDFDRSIKFYNASSKVNEYRFSSVEGLPRGITETLPRQIMEGDYKYTPKSRPGK